MKKRLRKKQHYGEFTVLGRQLVITRNRKDEFYAFFDAFIDIIEANDCYCYGGGGEDLFDVFIELGRPGNDREARVKGITAWLESRPDVESWTLGEEFDLWHENHEDT